MRGRDVLNKMLRPDQPTHAPAGGVEVFAGGADSEGKAFDFGGEGGHAGKRDVIEAVIHFVGEDDDFVLDAQVADFLKFLFGKDFSDGVICCCLVIILYQRLSYAGINHIG